MQYQSRSKITITTYLTLTYVKLYEWGPCESREEIFHESATSHMVSSCSMARE